MGPWGHAAVSCNAGPCNMQVIGSSVINMLIFLATILVCVCIHLLN